MDNSALDMEIQILFEILILFLGYTLRSPTNRSDDSSIFQVCEEADGDGSVYSDPEAGETVTI